MWETYKMWQMISFIKKHRIQLALQLNDQKAKDRCSELLVAEVQQNIEKSLSEKGEKPTQEEIGEMITSFEKEYGDEFTTFLAGSQVNSYNKEATVLRRDLINLLITTKYKELVSSEINPYNNEDLKNKKIELNSTIQSCIEKDKPFIKTCDDKGEEISLTYEGKQFAGIDGLIKAEISELGLMTTTILAIIGTAGAFNYQWLIKITGYISPLW